MTLGELIRNYRTSHSLSQRQFATLCDLSNGYISLLEKGENPKTSQPVTPTIPALQKIANGMNITLNELFSLVDDMLVKVSDEATDSRTAFHFNFRDPKDRPDIPGIIPLPKTYMVPLLGEIACGDPILAEQNIIDSVPVPEYIKGANFALTCKGDSMINARIHDGDIVYIRQQPEVENGQIAAVLIDNEATLKRIYLYTDKLVLTPENPAYPPMIFTGSELEQIQILGLAVGFTSKIK